MSLAVLFLTGCLSGCVPAIPWYGGTKIEKKDIITIIPGKTSKYEAIEKLGAPIAIAKMGERLPIPMESYWVPGLNLHTPGQYEINSDTFFELFSTEHEFNEYHRVYYYYRSKSSGGTVILLLIFYESYRLSIDKLWLLVNEKTGVVEDIRFKKRGKPLTKPKEK